jgi:hypothetical protein
MSDITDRARELATKCIECAVVASEPDEVDEAAALIASALQRERDEALREALTPGAEMKATCIGEFRFNIPDTDDDGDSLVREVAVPWVTIKEILAAIRARAALAASPEPKEESK